MEEQMQILITGANGFVGKNLVAHFSGKAERYNVASLYRRDVDLLNYDQVRQFLYRQDQLHTIIHCASDGGARKNGLDGEEKGVVENNLRMFHNIARSLKPRQRLIHLGSGAEYGKDRELSNLSEVSFDQHVPKDQYGFAKYVISKHIANMPNAICLRIFGLFGQHEDYRWKFISNAIIKNLLGLPIIIAQNAVFDYLYIRDFAELVERLIGQEHWTYRHINMTPSESVDLLTLAKIINEVGGNPSEIQILNEGLNHSYTGSNQRMLEMIGPYCFTSYIDAIRELMGYYRSVFDTLDVTWIKNDLYLQHCQAQIANSKIAQ